MDEILKHSSAVRAELASFIESKRRRTGETAWLADFLDRLENYATGGKLLRGSLLCFSYASFANKLPGEAVIKAAAALEMTHSALLIHDDIMDGDDLRRGQPSLHSQYRTLARNNNLPNSHQLGLNLALGAGDAVIFMAVEMLSQALNETSAKEKLLELYINQLILTCDGQMEDIYLGAQKDMPSKSEIYELMATKTAGYTIVLPIKMGAMLAGQAADDLDKLDAAGRAIGTIFQIRDDELGVMGDVHKTGKSVGSDIKQGKKTLLYYFLLEKSPPKQRAEIETIFGNPMLTAKDISYVQKLVEEAGVIDLLGQEVQGLKDKAVVAINQLPLPVEAKNQLIDLVDFCSKRQL